MMAVSNRMMVVLPAPSGPTKPKISPSSTVSVNSSTAVSFAEPLRQMVGLDGGHSQFLAAGKKTISDNSSEVKTPS